MLTSSVEDRPVISMRLEKMAANLGWEAASAYTSDGALKLLAEFHPGLAILEIQLGTTGSLAVAEQRRRSTSLSSLLPGYPQVRSPKSAGMLLF